MPPIRDRPAVPASVRSAAELSGRTMLAAIFLIDGVQQIRFTAATRDYIESFGVSGALLTPVILLHIVGGLAICAGFMTRIAAAALAVFTLAAALIFHTNLADVSEFNHFWKNVALAGAFVLLAVNGPGAWSVDGWSRQEKTRRRAPGL